MKKQVKYQQQQKCWMLRTMITAEYLSIYGDTNVGVEISKYVYSNVYSCESSFLFRGNGNDPVSS